MVNDCFTVGAVAFPAYVDEGGVKIMDLVWEGENMIPIPQVYSEAWEELKKQKGL